MTVYGLRNNELRCFQHFQRLMECRSDNGSCLPLEADYDECLHHRNEKRRNQQVMDQLRRNGGAGEVTTVARLVGLGLVDPDYTYADFKRDGGRWPMWLTLIGIKEPRDASAGTGLWLLYAVGTKKRPVEKE